MLGPFQAFCWKDWARFDTCASAKFHFHFDHCRAGSTSYGECFCTNRPFSQVHKDDSNMTFPWFSKKMTTKNVPYCPYVGLGPWKTKKNLRFFSKSNRNTGRLFQVSCRRVLAVLVTWWCFVNFFFVIFHEFFSRTLQKSSRTTRSPAPVKLFGNLLEITRVVWFNRCFD